MIIHPALRDVHVNESGYYARFHDLLFVVSECVESDGKRWRHASVSRRDHKHPLYEDLTELKRLTIGDDKTAIQIFPPADNQINFAGEHGIEVLH